MTTVVVGWPLAALLAVLAGAAAAVTRLAGLGPAREPLLAALRAAVQLAAVAAVIGFVLRSIAWTVLFLAAMIVVGAGTSARRIAGTLRGRAWWTIGPMLAGVVPAVALTLLSGAVPAVPVALLPTAGILIGGSMTATTLAGRRLSEELSAQRGPYEAALSLGLGRRFSVGLIARSAAAVALVPGLDQTRTVGLVTLPGAFVGVLLAGASPWQAGAAQVLVLVALLLVEAVAVAATVELVAAGLLPLRSGPLPE